MRQDELTHPMRHTRAAIAPAPMAGHRASASGTGWRGWLCETRQRWPALWWSGWALVLVSLPTTVAMTLDERQLLGVSVWLKPWKFQVSVAIQLFTLALMATALPLDDPRDRRVRRLAWIAIACGLMEVAYITGRGALGLESHFARGTPLTSALYTAMGVGAVTLTGCAGLLGLWIARARDVRGGPVLQRGLAWGLMLGWLLGTLAGAYLGGQSGHWVGGTASDAGGSALLHWSRDGGDLRVAHFFGLHAMQAIPLAALVADRLWQPVVALRAVAAFSLAWALLTVATFVQAVQGQPFLAG